MEAATRQTRGGVLLRNAGRLLRRLPQGALQPALAVPLRSMPQHRSACRRHAASAELPRPCPAAGGTAASNAARAACAACAQARPLALLLGQLSAGAHSQLTAARPRATPCAPRASPPSSWQSPAGWCPPRSESPPWSRCAASCGPPAPPGPAHGGSSGSREGQVSGRPESECATRGTACRSVLQAWLPAARPPCWAVGLHSCSAAARATSSTRRPTRRRH